MSVEHDELQQFKSQNAQGETHVAEIGKVEKFDLSKIRASRGRGEFMTKLLNLMPGEGFVVTGMERGTASTQIARLAKEIGDGRKFNTHSLGVGKFQVVRIK